MATATLSGILGAISGDLGNFNFRTTKNGIIIANRRKRTSAPSTTEQIVTRAFFSTASKQWQNLTDAERQGWKTYAATHFKFDKDGTGSGPSGQAVYLKAAWYLQATGASLPTSAPFTAPPAAPTGLSILNSSNDTSITIRATHSIASVTGYRLFVEITPPLASAARNPQPNDYRAARGIGTNSFPALVPATVPTGLSGIRFQLPAGARFGCRVSIISPQGIPSVPFAAVLTQQIT